MQNKKLVLTLGIIVLFVGAAAFIGGRFWNQRVGPADSISVTILPAIELPATSPAVTGPFIERQDNTITVETKSLNTGGAGVVPASGKRSESGPRVEILITNETKIYRDTTQLAEPLSDGNQTIQQTVEEATLEEMDTQSTLRVWGRRSGLWIIAEVLIFSDMVAIKSAIFKDCEICP